MSKIRPILPAALVPALFFAIVVTPVATLGCRNRGLLAVAVTLLGLFAALFLALRGLLRRWRGQGPNAGEIIALLLLILPALYLVLTEF